MFVEFHGKHLFGLVTGKNHLSESIIMKAVAKKGKRFKPYESTNQWEFWTSMITVLQTTMLDCYNPQYI